MKLFEERLEEIMNIRIQLKNMGIEAHYAEEMQPLFKIMNTFVREGASASGKVSIPATEFSKIEYKFTNTKDRDSFCRVLK